MFTWRREGSEYLMSLDVARGLAALIVVLWHWQHFFFNGSAIGQFDRQQQPLYDLFFIFYERGWLAVDFFFVLSGFIFYYIYSGAVAGGHITVRDFFWLRFSRLYPLHFFTLSLVAILQWLVFFLSGDYFVYQFNDLYHFSLNIFFASAWGLQDGFSFNAPVWSVSIEVLLYALFFLVVTLFPVRFWLVLLFAAVGFILQGYSELIGRGVFAFFVGASAFFIHQLFLLKRASLKSSCLLLFLCLYLWFFTILEFKFSLISRLPADFSGAFLSGKQAVMLWVVGILMPLSILVLVMLERYFGGVIFLRLSWLGRISYSSYLLHFPLQLLFFILFLLVGFERDFFYSLYAWFLYFLVLVFFGLLVHRYIEMPLQQWLRRRLLL